MIVSEGGRERGGREGVVSWLLGWFFGWLLGCLADLGVCQLITTEHGDVTFYDKRKSGLASANCSDCCRMASALVAWRERG